jgi:hypothetical protein
MIAAFSLQVLRARMLDKVAMDEAINQVGSKEPQWKPVHDMLKRCTM